MNTYFTNVKTLDELQTLYRKLLNEIHPDKHAGESPEQIAGWTVKTQQLNAEYAITAAKLRATDAKAKAKASGKPEPTTADFDSWAVVDEEIRKQIEKIVFLPDIEIEICGFWVWVSGETKPVRHELKAAGYLWAPKKEKWYFAGVPSSSRGSIPMEDIRARYGSTKVPTQKRTRLEDESK